ncbi:hypothetical protein WNY63_10145 [Pseudoalteromonas neustonica]|uniref:PsbP C-terminal domain-containing protein n=1 Tax=Pseudoalteromonas neustonica TaxID=1840331 RepID=A0ABU9U231_9GAMM
MIKYILIIAAAFGAYKFFFSSEGLIKSNMSEIHSSEYKFKITFPDKPREKSEIIDLPNYGKFKTVSYFVRKPELVCGIVISDYLDADEVTGDIYDQIDVAKRNLLNRYGSSINSEEFISVRGVSGYQFDVTTKDSKLLRMQIFKYMSNSYNLSCQYENSDDHKGQMNEFMDSFELI